MLNSNNVFPNTSRIDKAINPNNNIAIMSNDNIGRYSRQIILPEIGKEGQKILGESSATIIGCGALGNAIASCLARAGIGKIVLVDRDIVELDNLQRQMLFDENDVGEPKATRILMKLENINSDIELSALIEDVNPSNIEDIIKGSDVVLDGTDNMETRYLINDACIKNKIPWIYGGAISTVGMSLNIIPEQTCCLACVFPSLPTIGTLPTCDTVGILNSVPLIIGAIQSTEAIKLLLGKEINRDLIVYDIWTHDFQGIKVHKNEKCTCCGQRDFKYLNADQMDLTTVLCGRDAVQVKPISDMSASLEELSKRLAAAGEVNRFSSHLIFKPEKYEFYIFKNGRAIIKGVDDEGVARSLYAKYIGM
jgi:adenylyltransferase/sulfurtransferase